VAAAESQIRPDPYTGYFCNPYGPCEEWCASSPPGPGSRAGGPSLPTPSPATSTTGRPRTGRCSPRAPRRSPVTPFFTAPRRIRPPPRSIPDRRPGLARRGVVTIEGDAGPSATGHLAVITNGPYLPSQSLNYNGFGIYAWRSPSRRHTAPRSSQWSHYIPPIAGTGRLPHGASRARRSAFAWSVEIGRAPPRTTTEVRVPNTSKVRMHQRACGHRPDPTELPRASEHVLLLSYLRIRFPERLRTETASLRPMAGHGDGMEVSMDERCHGPVEGNTGHRHLGQPRSA